MATVGTADASVVEQAVKAARAAQEGVWGRMAPLERGKYLYRIARRLQESREFAVTETLDNGNPSAKRVTSTSPSPRSISSTTPAGATNYTWPPAVT